MSIKSPFDLYVHIIILLFSGRYCEEVEVKEVLLQVYPDASKPWWEAEKSSSENSDSESEGTFFLTSYIL